MQKSDYLSFFSLNQVNYLNQGFFGVSHFYNRTKTWAGSLNYEEVLKNSAGGRVLLGQIPVNNFNADLLKDLLPGGLIVSCNESYELSGCATVINVTEPHRWQQVGIEHLHLPFVDFTANVHPALLLKTLNEMLAVYRRGGAIYVHCKAGRSRSPLVAVLFMSILDLIAAETSESMELDLEYLLRKNIAYLQQKRPQTKIEENKVRLGIKILENYQNWSQESSSEVDEEEEFTQSAEFFNQLTQAPQFKALWHFAYNNPQYLSEMQTIMTALYEDPLKILEILRSVDWEPHNLPHLKNAVNKIRCNEEGCSLLVGLERFIDRHQTQNIQPVQSELSRAFKQFNQSLARYKKYPKILGIGRELESIIFLADASKQAKIDWLHKSARFLIDPERWAKSYYADAENAIVSENLAQRFLGELIFALAALVLTLTLVVCIGSTNLLTLPVALGIGIAALTFMATGKSLADTASTFEVKELSQQLVSKIITSF